MRRGVISNKQNCAAGRRDYIDTAPADDEKNKENNLHNIPCLLLRDGEMMARGCLSISLLEDVVVLMMWRELLLFGWALLIRP